MANVLTSFLIGIGFDTSKLNAGVRDVDRNMGQVKGSALKVSAALVGAFGAAAASVVNTASNVDKLALKTGNMRTSMQYVYNYGNALKRMGGNADEAAASIASIETLLNNLHFKGERGALNELSLAGIDTFDLEKTFNAEDFLAQLNRQLPRMSKEQRGVTQKALGLSDAELKTLSQAPTAFQGSLGRSEQLTGNIEELTENSRKLMENAADFSLAIEGITNELAKEFLPSLVGVSGWINSFLMENKGAINKGIKYAGQNAGATAALGAGAAASVIGAGLSKIGLKSLGGALTGAGGAGVAVAGGAFGANILNTSLDKYIPGYSEASRGFDKGLMQAAGLERIPSPLELLFGSPANSSAGLSPAEMSGATSGASKDEERQASADALAGALSRNPVKVINSNTFKFELDGQALESKITEVNERTAHETVDDMSSTTAR